VRNQAFNNYNEFLASALWKAIKAQIRGRSKRVCEFCRYNRSYAVHHRYYSKSGWGKEDLRDLMDVCKTCHDFIHGYPHPAKLIALPGSPALTGDTGWTSVAQVPGHWMLDPSYQVWIRETLPLIYPKFGFHIARQ